MPMSALAAHLVCPPQSAAMESLRNKPISSRASTALGRYRRWRMQRCCLHCAATLLSSCSGSAAACQCNTKLGGVFRSIPRAEMRARHPRIVVAAVPEPGQVVNIGKEMLAGRADAEANMRWRSATVVENKCAYGLFSVASQPSGLAHKLHTVVCG